MSETNETGLFRRERSTENKLAGWLVGWLACLPACWIVGCSCGGCVCVFTAPILGWDEEEWRQEEEEEEEEEAAASNVLHRERAREGGRAVSQSAFPRARARTDYGGTNY